MNYVEWNFSEVSFGNTSLKIFYNGIFQQEVEVPCFNLSGENYDQSIIEFDETLFIDNVNFTIDGISSNSGIYISINCFENDEDIDYDLFDITIIENGDEDEDEDEIIDKKISTYSPVLSYTTTASAVMYGLNDITEKKLLPIFFIEDTNRLENYLKDDLIDYEHFIDLFEIEDIINKAQREEQKKKNKELRKQKIKAKKLDDPIKESMSIDDIIDLYKNIDSNENIIPIYQIKDSDVTEEILANNLTILSERYNKIGLRIVDQITFILQHQNILNILNKKFDDFYLIFDMNNNFNINTIKNLLNLVKDQKNLIYLGANFESTDMTIARDEGNKNHYREDKVIDIFFELSQYIDNLGYGDYCGFDKKTITKFRGMATARVILCSLEKGDNTILIRRGWDKRDLTANPRVTGYKYSMKRLLKDISEGKIEEPYLNENICDADSGLKSFGETTTTPGNIKTMCLRHNVYSIIYRYMMN